MVEAGNCLHGPIPPGKCLDSLNFYYFNREKQLISHVTSERVTSTELPHKLLLHKDSPLCFVSHKVLIIGVGAHEVNGIVSLDLETHEIKALANLPFGVEGGQLHFFNNQVFYVNGVHNGEAQILVYCMNENKWEVRHEKPQVEVVKGKKSAKDGKRSYKGNKGEFKLKTLLNAGSILAFNKIWFIGGQRKQQNHSLKASYKVYSIDLSASLTLTYEKIRLGFPVLRPSIGLRGDSFIVAAGFDLNNESNVYSCSISTKTKSFKLLDSLFVKFNENFPVIETEEFSIFVSYPVCAVRFTRVHYWVAFVLDPHKFYPTNLSDKVLDIRGDAENSDSDSVEVKTEIEIIYDSSSSSSSSSNDEKKKAKVGGVHIGIKPIVENIKKKSSSSSSSSSSKKNKVEIKGHIEVKKPEIHASINIQKKSSSSSSSSGKKSKKSSSSSSSKEKKGIGKKIGMTVRAGKANTKKKSSSSSSSSKKKIQLVHPEAPKIEHPKSEEIKEKSVEIKKKVKDVSSVSSSDISDAESDFCITCKIKKVKSFWNMVGKLIKVPAPKENEMDNRIKSTKARTKLSIDQVIELLKGYLPNKEYDVKLIVNVCSEIHKKFRKIQLKPKECWVVIMASGILPTEKLVDKERFAVALARSLKYIILRKT